MNDIQLYDYYCSLPLEDWSTKGFIYPDFCVITGYAFCHPHPHRHYTFDEFIDRLNEDNNELRNFLNELSRHPVPSFEKKPVEYNHNWWREMKPKNPKKTPFSKREMTDEEMKNLYIGLFDKMIGTDLIGVKPL